MWWTAVAAAGAGELRVEVSGVVGSDGVVACLLFAGSDGFPGDAARAVGRAVAPIVDGHARCAFADPPAGRVAVAVVHDRDQDLTLDANWLGMPTEGYGFSAGAVAGRFGPPSFEAASFDPASIAGTPGMPVTLVYR